MLLRHVLRNALIPYITILGLEFGTLLAGAVVTETVFAWPGLGYLMVRSLIAVGPCRPWGHRARNQPSRAAPIAH